MYAWTGPLLCVKQLQAGKKAAGRFVASSGGISSAYRSKTEHLKAKKANVELIAKVRMLLVAVWFNGTCSLPQFHQFSSNGFQMLPSLPKAFPELVKYEKPKDDHWRCHAFLKDPPPPRYLVAPPKLRPVYC